MTLAEKLAAPLDPNRVKHREGSGGRSLSYLEGHDVIRTANEVFGPGEWGYHVDDLTCLGEEPVSKNAREGFRVAYRATVAVHATGLTGFSDVGYGDAMEYTGSKLTPHELASKEAVTDALKRALKNFGDQFGLCLYDKDAPEHNGSNGSAGGQQKVAARAPGTDGNGSGAPATNYGSAGSLKWKYGPHAGVTIADTPLDFVVEYAGSGTNAFMVGKCKAFLEETGATEDADGDIDGDSIPF